jgi:hypothetical protein
MHRIHRPETFLTFFKGEPIETNRAIWLMEARIYSTLLGVLKQSESKSLRKCSPLEESFWLQGLDEIPPIIGVQAYIGKKRKLKFIPVE